MTKTSVESLRVAIVVSEHTNNNPKSMSTEWSESVVCLLHCRSVSVYHILCSYVHQFSNTALLSVVILYGSLKSYNIKAVSVGINRIWLTATGYRAVGAKQLVQRK